MDTLFIKVRLDGEQEFRTIRYDEFLAAPQVDCKIRETNKKVKKYREGTGKDEKGRHVPLIRKDITFEYELETPEDKIITIPDRVANA